MPRNIVDDFARKRYKNRDVMYIFNVERNE